MLIALLTYIKPLHEVDAFVPSHLYYLKGFFKQKKLLISGRRQPRTGGVIIANNISREEFEKIMKEDPFAKAGVSEYQIIEFTPGLCDESFAKFLGIL